MLSALAGGGVELRGEVFVLQQRRRDCDVWGSGWVLEGLRGCPDASSLASSGNEKGDVMVQNHKHLLSFRRKCTRGNLRFHLWSQDFKYLTVLEAAALSLQT